MVARKIGRQTLAFQNPPVITGTASVVGPKEGDGPLGRSFDVVKQDSILGEMTWEKAESCMMYEASLLAVKKAGLAVDEVDLFLGGDLLNQIICCNFTARDLSIPFFGLYNACATFTEGLALGSALVDAGFARHVLVGACSHHETAERQYRYPTEFANQRPPTAHWTATAAGAAVLSASGKGPRITHATVGRVVDMGLKDPNDMGSCMAPAAAETIWQHFQDTGFRGEDYDLVVTGDLGGVGKGLAGDLLAKSGYDLSDRLHDCGIMIYDPAQGVNAGGSGAGCSAAVFSGYLVKRLLAGEIHRLLLVATGSLHSPTSYQQGESIPGIAHAITIQGEEVQG